MTEKKAYAWSEKVIYVSCPHCKNDECLGEGVLMGETYECPKCGKVSEVDDHT